MNTIVETYAKYEPIQLANDVTLNVGDADGNQWPVHVYDGDSVQKKRRNAENPTNFRFANFSFSGTLTVTCTYDFSVANAIVRPLTKNIEPTINGNEVTFTLSEPANVSVEVNEDLSKPLFVFANALEEAPPADSDPDVIYFGPGTHEAGVIRPESNQTVYIHGSAYVSGKIRVAGKSNVTVKGRGVLSAAQFAWPQIFNYYAQSSSIHVRDIILYCSPGWANNVVDCDDVNFSGVKIMSWAGNNDGIDVVGSKNCDVANSFIFTNDDCIAYKAFNVASSVILEGSGTGFSGAADAGHFMYHALAGDCSIRTDLVDLTNGTNSDAKYGIMIRESLNADSRNVFLSFDRGKHATVQRRSATGGSTHSTSFTSTVTTGDLTGEVRLDRQENTFRAYVGTKKAGFQLLDTILNPMEGEVLIGFAVTSHDDSELAYCEVGINSGGNPAFLIKEQESDEFCIPTSNWHNTDIGTPGIAGRAYYGRGRTDCFSNTVTNTTMWNLSWGNAVELGFELECDQVHDITIANCDIIHVEGGSALSIHNGDAADVHDIAWENIRVEDTKPAKDGNIEFYIKKTRYSQDPERGQINNIFLRNVAFLEDNNSTFEGYNSNHLVRDIFFTNLVINDQVIATAAQGNMQRSFTDNFVFNVGPEILGTLTSADIGTVGIPGSVTPDGNSILVSASGVGIGSEQDAFGYLYRASNQPGSLTARIAEVSGTNPTVTAGLMMRQTLEPDSPHVMLAVTPSQGITLESRYQVGLHTPVYSVSNTPGSVPYWLKLDWSGPWFGVDFALMNLSTSFDGITWSSVAFAPVNLSQGSAYFGLCVASRDDSTLATVRFDNVSVGETIAFGPT